MKLVRKWFRRFKWFFFSAEFQCPNCGENCSVHFRSILDYYAGWVLQKLILFTSIFLFVALGVFLRFDGVTYGQALSGKMDSGSSDLESISIPNSGMVELNDGYNESVEKAWCMFGEINGGEVFVKDMDFVENPINQSKDSLRTYCLSEIYSKKFRLLSTDYNFLGLTHTHPDSSHRLSFRDIHTFGKASFVVDVMGVYDGEELNYWSNGELHDELKLDVRRPVSSS